MRKNDTQAPHRRRGRSAGRRTTAAVSAALVGAVALGALSPAAHAAGPADPPALSVPQHDASVLPYKRTVAMVSEDGWQRGKLEIRAGSEVAWDQTTGITVNVKVSDLEHYRGFGWFGTWWGGSGHVFGSTYNVTLTGSLILLRDGQRVGAVPLDTFGYGVEELSFTHTFDTGGVPGDFMVVVHPVVKGIYWGGTDETYKSDLYPEAQRIELGIAK